MFKRCNKLLVSIVFVLTLLISTDVISIPTSAEQVMTGVSQVVGGRDSAYAIKTNGTLWATGINDCGQFGDGTTNSTSTWKQILTSVSQVAAGCGTTYALRTDGTLWATGYDYDGEMGDNYASFPETYTWKQVLTNVSRVAAGQDAAYAVKTDGTLWATGDNYHGQLGDGTTTETGTWEQVLTNVSQVSSNPFGFSAYAIETDGTLWATGYNDDGQLGDGTTTDAHTWEQVLSNIAQVVEDNGYDCSTFAIDSNGGLWVTGANESGEFGVSGYGAASSDMWKQTLYDSVKQVGAGWNSSYIIKTDGTLWAAGTDGYSQLGDGNSFGKYSYNQVFSNVAQVAAGTDYSSYAIKTDGTLWAVGNNNYGQLGDGTTTNVSAWEVTPPTITATETTSGWHKSAIINVSASDMGSGLQYIKNPNGTTTTNTSETYTVNSNGTYTFTAYDNDNNQNTASVTVTNIDSTAPTISATPSTTAWTNGAMSINVSASDSGSGLTSIKNPDDTTTSSGAETYPVSSNGTYTFIATDNAGNSSSSTVTISNIDSTPPTGSYNLSTTNWTTGNVTINVTATDTQSGVKSITLPNGTVVNSNTCSYTATNNGTYNFTLTDNAGNTCTYPVTVANIDRSVSVSYTSGAAYTVDPNNTGSPFSAEDITLTNNNTHVGAQVTLQSLASALSGTNCFTLGVQVEETATGNTTWSEIDNKSVQLPGGASTVLGVLSPGGTGHIKLVGQLGSLRWPSAESDTGSVQMLFTAVS